MEQTMYNQYKQIIKGMLFTLYAAIVFLNVL